MALWQVGAKVTFSDARQEHLDEIMRRYPGIAGKDRVVRIDQESQWSLDRRFDLVINHGLLYHLRNWRLSVDCSLAHSDVLLLESAVHDIDDPNYEVPVAEEGYDQAFGGQGTVLSAAAIEAHLQERNCRFLRFDDADLTAPEHRYDWIDGQVGPKTVGLRRFWLVCRSGFYPPYIRQRLKRMRRSRGKS